MPALRDSVKGPGPTPLIGKPEILLEWKGFRWFRTGVAVG